MSRTAPAKRKHADTTPELRFNPSFNEKRAGDIILQAGDPQATCFYFSKTLLAAVSSFFACLPSPSPADLVDGTPLVPLHGTTSIGLALFLHAAKSTVSIEPFDWLTGRFPHARYEQAMLNCAVLAKMFDAPLIPRLLVESIGQRDEQEQVADSYLIFAIWAIGDVTTQLQRAATATLRPDEGEITGADATIISMCRQHAPQRWSQLQDLHLRRIQAPNRLHARLRKDCQPLTRPFPADPTSSAPCCSRRGKVSHSVFYKLLQTRTFQELLAFWDEFSLDCDDCAEDTAERFSGDFQWLKEYSSQLVL